MALEQKLSLKLSQKLVMTPSLQQAIKLLQMTRMELETLVSQELVENPILEESQEVQTQEDSREAEKEKPKEEKEELNHEESMENIDLEAYFGDYFDTSGYPSVAEIREAPPLENTLTQAPDLYDQLLWQLHMSEVGGLRRQLAEYVIGNLDEDGFLVATVEEIADMGIAEEGVDGKAPGEPFPPEEVEAAIALVQSFEPAGVACRDLRESLLRQLEARDRDEECLACRMVSEHWESFLKRQFPSIAKQLGVELKELEPAVELIRSLETRPGRLFGNERAQYIEPDVYVYKVGDEYVIQLNDDGLPRLRVSRAYRRMLQRMREDGNHSDAQQFIKDKMRSAVWLIKSLDQRQRTIYKVAKSIVDQQRGFLDRGIDKLRPMVLRDVAEDIAMHESTVSRVVSNKYIHTPRGVFPMKFFFHSGIDREYGENISSLSVKRKISTLVAAEDPSKPLSDSELMRILKREGIQIARRTVAKYRDELGIPASTDRKKIF